jgi:large subunit ribosomal protein L23
MITNSKKTKQLGLENGGVTSDQTNTTKELSSKAIVSMIDLVKYPVITEKSYIALYKNSQYTFDIDKRLTKTQIKKLFLSLFNVNVIAVNTHIPPRKQIRVGMAQGFRPTYKRAIITLQKGQSINYNLMAEKTN